MIIDTGGHWETKLHWVGCDQPGRMQEEINKFLSQTEGKSRRYKDIKFLPRNNSAFLVYDEWIKSPENTVDIIPSEPNKIKQGGF